MGMNLLTRVGRLEQQVELDEAELDRQIEFEFSRYPEDERAALVAEIVAEIVAEGKELEGL